MLLEFYKTRKMKKTVQTITRKCNFDSGHRVMNEAMKCFNIHGHTYLAEVTFEFNEMEEIGYAIDFKEIKRVGLQWIDDILDHGMILNPEDRKLIETTLSLGSKLWLMSLNGVGKYCNPSAENIAKEIFLAQEVLFQNYENLEISHIKLAETPNCWVGCTKDSISKKERKHWRDRNLKDVSNYAKEKGIMEYDDRKIK